MPRRIRVIVAQGGLEDRVHVFSPRDLPQSAAGSQILPNLMRTACVFLTMSITEGFGMAACEAAECGYMRVSDAEEAQRFQTTADTGLTAVVAMAGVLGFDDLGGHVVAGYRHQYAGVPSNGPARSCGRIPRDGWQGSI